MLSLSIVWIFVQIQVLSIKMVPINTLPAGFDSLLQIFLYFQKKKKKVTNKKGTSHVKEFDQSKLNVVNEIEYKVHLVWPPKIFAAKKLQILWLLKREIKILTPTEVIWGIWRSPDSLHRLQRDLDESMKGWISSDGRPYSEHPLSNSAGWQIKHPSLQEKFVLCLWI